jgi:hypothetical protein
MPSRRILLSTLATGCTVTFAGCLDTLDMSSDDGEPNQDRPDEETTNPPDNAQSDVLTDQLVNSYETAWDSLKTAEEEFSTGRDYWNSDNLSQADGHLVLAIDLAEGAVTNFSNAAEIAGDVDNRTARDMAQDAEDHARLHKSASEQFKRATEAAIEGKNSVANTHLEEGSDLRDEVDATVPPSVEEFRSTVS